ncbi:MAG: hypothetical protein IPJ41_02725 [Phycisphaerales bacterium]|nr:hypothetical protein [Phycisphaerales bacterium]
MKRWLTCGMEAGTPEGRRAVVRLMWWMIALSVVVVVAMEISARVVRANEGIPGVWRALIALAPLAPFVGMIAVFARAYKHLDEMLVRMQFEALAYTLGLVIVVVVGWGQLQQAKLLPMVEVSMVWPLAAFVYAPCLLAVRRRYK